MTDTDAIGAIDEAIFAALDAAITGATVYQDAPQDVPLPVVIVGDIDNAVRIGGKGENDWRVPVTIVVLTEGDERAPCAALLDQVDTILHDASLDGGAFIVRPLTERTSAVLAEDGSGYIGLAQFTVLAFAN